MDILVYKLLHIAGVMGLFLSLGALLAAKESLKGAVIGHGVSLFVILVAGFGMQAKGAFGFPGWMIAKLAIWLLLGAFLVVAKRRLLPVPAAAGICVVLGIAAAWLAIYKPF